MTLPSTIAGACKRHLTLFQCAQGQGTSKRARKTDNEDGNLDLPESPVSDSDLDDDSEPAHALASGTLNRRQQTNTIQIDKPVGATTIIINADSEKSVSQPSQSNESTHGQCPPSDLGGIGASPTRPKGINFPTTNFSGKNRSFNAKWYDEFDWLEYSISRDAAFCYPCRMFTAGRGKSESTFTVVGFRDWKHASGKSGVLQNHDKCSVHKSAVIAWGQYKYGSYNPWKISCRST